MPVRAVVLDSSLTLVDAANQLVSGAPEAVQRLKALDLYVATGSNQVSYTTESLRKAGAPVNRVLSRATDGAKGGGKWVRKVAQLAGCEPHEVVVVGDDTMDVAEAVNSGSALFDATWGKGAGYGIQLAEIRELPYYLETFFMKTAPWYWSLDDKDANGRGLRAYAVIDPNVADTGMRWSVLGWLKEGYDQPVGKHGLTVASFVMTQLFASIYLSGVAKDVDIWTTLPGHRSGDQNVILRPELERQAKMFRGRRYRELLRRHTDAPDSGTSRRDKKGHLIKFENQVNTLVVDADPKDVVGKRILLIDDVITEGYTAEFCRNALLAAGAADVVTVAVEKYAPRYASYAYQGNGWDPRRPAHARADQFAWRGLSGTTDPQAQAEFVASYQTACR